MKRQLPAKLLLLLITVLTLTTGCERFSVDPYTPINNNPAPTPTQPVNDAIKVTANLSGIVLDENNAPVAGATVVSGTATTTTNIYGGFVFRKIALSKANGSVTVTKAGYFKGIRSFKTIAGKDNMVKIKLMARNLSGTIPAATGGVISSNGGATISFPANAFITANGSAYTGDVKVFSRWIDPTSVNLPFIMPGDLRGITSTGMENILETYGMVGAELEDPSGNPLKIAPGKTAAVQFPIPAALSASAPATIQLWHFNETAARWKEEGTATKSGSSYTAQVNKFSFWNCDFGIENYIDLNYTIINGATNTPVVGAVTRLKPIPYGGYGYGYTNNTGLVNGLVPRDQVFVLEVLSDPCGNVIFSQNIGPFSVNTNLGNIVITIPPTIYINFTGKVLNCLNNPVTDGYVSMYGTGGYSGFTTTNATGDFSFTVLNCTNNNLSYTYMAVDNATMQQSTVGTGNATSGTINLGNISTCTTPTTVSVYITGFEPVSNNTPFNTARVWKDAAVTNLSDGTKNGLAYGVFVSGSDVYVTGREELPSGFSICRVWKNGTVLYTLTNGTGYAQANAITISGGDVYVAGSIAAVPTVWKNGVPSSLPATSSGHATCIAVSGTDVYVGTNETWGGNIYKNGVSLYVLGNLTAVAVSGTDVYAAGDMGNHTTLWKNGIPTTIDNGPTESRATGIALSGSDVYVSGYVRNVNDFFTVAKVWKNGVATSLTNGLHYGTASAVQVVGNDVYVAGHDAFPSGGNQQIYVWKNNLPVAFTNGTYSAFSTGLFVK